MISPFTSPPPPSLPFTLTPPSVNLPLLLFILWYSPQISETAGWWCHRSLSQSTRGPPSTSKHHLKSVMASGITWALLLVWSLSKYIWFKWSKIWIFGWDRPESPPTQEIAKVEEGHDKTYNSLKFALRTFLSYTKQARVPAARV